MQQAKQTTHFPPRWENFGHSVRSKARSLLIPYANKIEEHPVYHMELRRQRSDRSLSTLLQYSLARLTVIGGVLVTIWLMVFISELEAVNNTRGYFETQTSDTILTWSIYIGLGASILLDFTAIVASVGGINRDQSTATWNLLQVSAIRRFDIIVVKHTIAQLRVWRIVAIISSVRIATVVIAVLYVLGQTLWHDGIGLLLEDLTRALMEHPLETLLSLYILGITAVVYVAEVLWRVRGVTAIGTAISARVKSPTSSVLAGFGGVVTLWISQAIVIGVLFWFTDFVAGRIDPVDDLGILVVLAGFATLYTIVIYGYYTSLRAWCLRHSVRHAFRE